MLRKWNEKFLGRDCSEIWINLTMVMSILCLAIPVIWGTWFYWAEMLSNIPEEVSFFTETMLLITFALIYLILLGVLGWLWSYASVGIGLVVSTVALPFIWLYRRICA